MQHILVISAISISSLHLENCALHILNKSETLHRGCLFSRTAKMGKSVQTDLEEVFITKHQSALHIGSWKVEFHLVLLLELLGDAL